MPQSKTLRGKDLPLNPAAPPPNPEPSPPPVSKSVSGTSARPHLYVLTWRDKFGAKDVMIEAKDLETAEKVGRAWIAKQPVSTAGVRVEPNKFVKVAPFVVADESIL